MNLVVEVCRYVIHYLFEIPKRLPMQFLGHCSYSVEILMEKEIKLSLNLKFSLMYIIGPNVYIKFTILKYLKCSVVLSNSYCYSVFCSTLFIWHSYGLVQELNKITYMQYLVQNLFFFFFESHIVVSDSLGSHGLFMEFSRPEYWSG